MHTSHNFFDSHFGNKNHDYQDIEIVIIDSITGERIDHKYIGLIHEDIICDLISDVHKLGKRYEDKSIR